MSRFFLLTTCLLLAGLTAGGCTNPDGSPMEWKDPMAETKAKYPTYPEWGWWDHPADEVALAGQLLPEEESQHVARQGQAQDQQRRVENAGIAQQVPVSLTASGSARCPR